MSEPERESALEVIEELFKDFPFESQADRAIAWAVLFTLLLRSLIRGPVPLFNIDAPSQGTGKTLKVRATTVVTTGREPAMMAPPGERDDAEMRKRITSTLSFRRDSRQPRAAARERVAGIGPDRRHVE